MELLSQVDNNQEKVNNVFRQLLQRLSLRKTAVNRPHRALNILYKGQEMAKSRRLSAGLSFKSYGSPQESPDTSFRTPKRAFISEKKNHQLCQRRLPIKGSLSNRSKTGPPHTEQDTVDHKIQEYNQLLITRSYIFSELDIRRVSNISKLSGSAQNRQPCNFERTYKVPFRELRRNKECFRKQNWHYPNLGPIQTLTKCLNKNSRTGFQPWETDDTDEQQ